MTISRREFLAAVALIGLTRKSGRPIAGGFVDDGARRGHRLRDGDRFPAPRRIERAPIVIAGGGMAGLCAAWRLRRRGMHDFVLLELEPAVGGNSRWGESDIGSFPWGAHYLPVPDRGATLVRELLEELGVLREGVFGERHLCYEPQERLWLHGRWQPGLALRDGLTPGDREQLGRFDERIAGLRASGEFTVPLSRGRRPSALDTRTMGAWMRDEGFDAPALRWAVDYATRDDFGGRPDDVSAWAGLHYFASRDPDAAGPLTWPEGNGWIARRHAEMASDRIRTRRMVHRVERRGARLRVHAGDTAWDADAVVWAAPSFLAPHVVDDAPALPRLEYSPWLTAAITLERWPDERGAPPAWDNVLHESPALGYVVATHQTLRTRIDRTIWTYYWALADGTPAENRAVLLTRPWREWVQLILADLGRAHRDIEECVSRVDIMRFGHAMARPTVGFLEATSRLRRTGPGDRIFLANSDLSGLSLFEEAQDHGIHAADRALAVVGGTRDPAGD